MEKCQTCKKDESTIRYGEERFCLTCYNTLMTEELGVEATSYPKSLSIRDGLGEVHRYRLRKRLDPIGVIMEAEEQVEEGGYFFQLSGDIDCDQEKLLMKLLAKAEKGMAEAYVEEKLFEDETTYHGLRNERLAGRIEWNPAAEEIPLLVVDGKPYMWEQIGKLLMHYEGFQLKMEILDPGEEIEWNKDK
ncbi:DUF7713 domain-containing protein [Planomicrobium okeanokoites]|uniref:DUF4178 domain-containing protein n=1 Tax=Planomicrobium okeanokoites TaxID=244 RepID=A0ABV7KN70_PLAOK|nr:hypothetical protein [Planomicrobium okeanokoites]TAA66069.1 hypothetical protein D2910_15590 [Planomicrobium okeanokoites]